MRFFAPGTPAPKGSSRAITRGGFAVLVASSSNANRDAQKSWAASVAWSARAAGLRPLDGPVNVEIAFAMPRGRSVKRAHPTVKPDIDKLLRTALDALTGIAWVDDAQVVRVVGAKDYATRSGRPGAWITVEPANVDEEQER